MKFLFKCFLLIILLQNISFAREIIVVSYNQHLEKATLIRKLMIENLSIPKKLITLKKTIFPCDTIDGPIIHFCVESNGHMKVASMQKNIITKSLGVFMKN